jgi:hypothetical protein
VVVDPSSVVVVVGSGVVVVVGSRVVVVGATVVVVGSTVLTGAGWGSVVGATDGGGAVELGGRVGGAVGAGAVVVQVASGTGATPGGCFGTAREVDDASARVLEGAAGPVAGAAVVSFGRAPTTLGAGGAVGTRAAEATTAAIIAKVSPNATSIRR